ncbi:MAG: phosphate ABC transporter substrate-binding protein PstS [Candidatus Eremiobacteraeota bacterium]|nr:phosphate ABC transporter substrate-binding protein PstS [Candidatus Eremiobacteraeota bacterium]MBC5826377.1 phosphate ABC transporter substrate-binding protein PstS [Candidatus Eremiobacteraeota bacterium]
MAALMVVFGGCTSHSDSGASSQTSGERVIITGAGSSFDYPFFTRAFYQYSQEHPGISVNYQSIGSGGGIQQFSNKTVDFGATDVPMNAKELGQADSAAGIVQLPIALGGVAVAYNVPDAPEHLKLSGALLASIFSGSIRDWNDPAIARLNPGGSLKSLPIVVVHRADGSGTTFIFTDYLSAVDASWKRTIGKGKSISWAAPSAVGAKGNEGVAGQIQNTPGAIGYVELSYALQNKMSYAAIENRSHAFILPSPRSIAAAAAAKPAVSAKDFSIVDAAGPLVYPISGYSWLLVYHSYPDSAKEAAIRNLFRWVLGAGQKLAATVNYVPLPTSVSVRAQTALTSSPR